METIFQKLSEKEKSNILEFLRTQKIDGIEFHLKAGGVRYLKKTHPEKTGEFSEANRRSHFYGSIESLSSDGVLTTKLLEYKDHPDSGNASHPGWLYPSSTEFKLPVEFIDDITIVNLYKQS